MKIACYVSVLYLMLFQSLSSITWVTPTTHDFGTIQAFDEQVYTFQFRNETNTPILIDNVRTTCGCTAPTWSEDLIMPDSISGIDVHYDAKHLGFFKKKIKVFVSSQRKAEVLTITGEVMQ